MDMHGKILSVGKEYLLKGVARVSCLILALKRTEMCISLSSSFHTSMLAVYNSCQQTVISSVTGL